MTTLPIDSIEINDDDIVVNAELLATCLDLSVALPLRGRRRYALTFSSPAWQAKSRTEVLHLPPGKPGVHKKAHDKRGLFCGSWRAREDSNL